MIRRKLLLLASLLLTCVGVGQADAQKRSSAKASPTYVEGKVRVKLQREVALRLEQATLPSGGVLKAKGAAQYVQTGVTQLDRVGQKVRAVSMTRVFPEAGKDEARHKEFGLDLWYDVSYDESTMSPAQVRNLYKAVPGVSHAQRIPVYQLEGGNKFREVAASEVAKAAAKSRSSVMPFSDPLLSGQWHYNNDGSMTDSKVGADINLFQAWKSGVYGSKDVVVAIIDGGFQVDHPDLKDNVWINEAELNGQPGVDDDGDGYVDDIYGYNFVINSADINAHSHGTHVAGTVGATNGNGIGVCGVAGGSDGTGGVKMMVCQVYDSRSSSGNADFAAAIVYAADRGASIAQCSWGSSYADEIDQSIVEAVNYFTQYGGGDKMNGGLCIFASGNTSDEGNYWPQCMDNVVAVGASTISGEPAYYSTQGSWVDVTAPGGLEDYGEKFGVLSTLPNGTYGYSEGTSMACPHVSGVAALILSKYGNKQFSNETLRTLLTSSVSKLDYTNYPSYEGKMGSGLIDAYKALQGKEGAVPDAVADFTLTPSHDNVLVEWTIPQSGDEGVIDHHVIYYSTEAFTATDNLNKLNSASVDTKYQASGESMSYEVTGLKANTKYYFAIVAYNRWGTASAVSPVKEATTNAGPVASVDRSSLSMTVDGAGTGVAEASFNVSNTGEGILKYELAAATKRVTYSTSARNIKPQPGKLVPFSGKMTPSAATSHEIVSADYKASDYPKQMTWGTSLLAYLGEDDTTLPNAMAQYFKVDKDSFPDGFNLTALYFKGAYGENPDIEIYDGTRSIGTASLLQKVDYDYFGYYYDISLKEQIYFEPGSSFWVVAKFPAGQTNPLGAATVDGSAIPQYSFYSSDNGQSWTQLSEVVKGGSFESYANQLTWAITCKSKNPDWSAVLNPDPQSGEVRPGASQQVTLKNDGQKLVNGTYNFNLRLKTNEASASDNQVAVTMKVSGYKPEMTSKKFVDFGSLLVGESKTLSVELVNNGYGLFGGRYGAGFYSYNGGITTTSDQFDVSAGAPSVSARSSNTMDLTFKPTTAGDHSTTITLKDANGNTYSFVARGVASEPAHLAVSPEAYDFDTLTVGGAQKTATFTLKNEGKYPLQYVFPKFSDESIEGATAKAHKFGYTYQANFNGDDLPYEEAPELADEVDITSQFTDNNWQSGEISLGFQFPFYGVNYDKVHVTSRGGIAMNTIQGSIGCMVGEASCMKGLGSISAWGSSGYLTADANSKISYGHKDGNFVVKFKDVISNGDMSEFKTSFHIVLSPDGSSTFYYDDYDRFQATYSGGLMYLGVADENLTDPFTITDNEVYWANTNDPSPIYANIQTGTVVKIVAPAKSMVESVSPADGYIGIGETQELTVTVAANDSLNAGALTNYLVMLTNDPDNASKSLTLTATIAGDNLKPVASTDVTSVDFGDVFRTSTQTRTIALTNKGQDVLKVASVASSNSLFTVGDELKDGFTVAAGNGKDVTVGLNTETSQEASGTLTITYGDSTKDEIALKARIIGTPVLTIDPESIEETTAYGEAVAKDITLSNGGDEPMDVTITPDTWFTINDVTATDGKSSVDYSYKSSVDGYDVAYDWQDITSDYTEHMPYSYYYGQTDYKEVTLPFEFPFYGKNYSKMYIYNTGFVKFDKPDVDYKEFPEPPSNLPSTETFYGNIICPYWGNHSMSTSSSDGVYYKEQGDEVVVSFLNYGNSMMTGMNYQVILRKDGTFKFQYNVDTDGMFLTAFGLCGIMDETFKRGVNPADRYISPGSAMEWSPVMSYTVAAGEQKAVAVTLHADELADTYIHEMQLATNVPGKESVSIPVALTITGEPQAVFPEQVEIEEVASPLDDWGYGGETFYKEFAVKNLGTKAFTITDIQCPAFEMDYDTWMQEAQLMVESGAFGDSDGGDDIGPGPLSLQSDDVTWLSYTPGYSSPIVVGKDSIRFRIALYNSYTIHDATNDMTFYLEGLDETEKTVKLRINITDAPAMVFDKDSIYVVNADDTFKDTETMTISNEGNYKLKYSFHLDASGNDAVEETDEGGDDGGIAPAMLATETSLAQGMELMKREAAEAKLKKVGAKASAYIWDLPGNFTGTNSLYYPILQPASSAKAYWIGALDEENEFYTATQFTAPAEGFNLTHLYFAGTVRELENVDIESYVVKGDDVTATDNIVARGKLHIDQEQTTETPSAKTIEFNHPSFFNPNEKFYIVVKYPAGNPYSTYLVSKDGDKCANRYMCYIKSMGWFDMEEVGDANYSMGANGWFMTALEQEPGEPWIKLLNSDTEGELAVGESLPVRFEVDASKTYQTNQKATLVITSNDPNQKLVNYHIRLNKNAAPDIATPEATPTVKEADSAMVAITVADPDGDAFTVGVSDEDGIASIGSCSPEEGVSVAEDGTVSVAAHTALTLNVKLQPDYGMAGTHTFKVTAKDAKGNESEANVAYNVEFTNRAPAYVGMEEIELVRGTNSETYKFASLFTDPDGDEMTYSVSSSNERRAAIFTSDNGFIISPLLSGTAYVTVKATDANGASTEGSIKVTITTPSGIDGVSAADGSLSVSDASADGNATVTFGVDADNVNLMVYNAAGQTVQKLHLAHVSAGQTVTINLAKQGSGVYSLAATIAGNTTVVKFAKR